MEQLNLEMLKGSLLNKEVNYSSILYKISTEKGVYEFNSIHYGMSDRFLTDHNQDFYLVTDGKAPLALVSVDGEVVYILNPTKTMDNDIYLFNKYRLSREQLISLVKKEYEKMQNNELNLEIKSAKLSKETVDTESGNINYIFEIDNQLYELETRINSKIHNSITSNLGATSEIRNGKDIDLIVSRDLILGLYLDGETIITEYFNGRFDGMELYLQETYGITTEEVVNILKNKQKSRKLTK